MSRRLRSKLDKLDPPPKTLTIRLVMWGKEDVLPPTKTIVGVDGTLITLIHACADWL